MELHGAACMHGAGWPNLTTLTEAGCSSCSSGCAKPTHQPHLACPMCAHTCRASRCACAAARMLRPARSRRWVARPWTTATRPGTCTWSRHAAMQPCSLACQGQHAHLERMLGVTYWHWRIGMTGSTAVAGGGRPCAACMSRGFGTITGRCQRMHAHQPGIMALYRGSSCSARPPASLTRKPRWYGNHKSQLYGLIRPSELCKKVLTC